jgi:hypothetical protein
MMYSDEVPAPAKPEEKRDEVQDDYEFSRLTYYKLVQSGLDMLPTIEALAKDSEQPRAFEVFTGLLKGISDINGEFLKLQALRKQVVAQTGIKHIGSNATQIEDASGEKRSVVWEGTPAEMLKSIEDKRKIDEPEIVEAVVEEIVPEVVADEAV